MVGISFNGSTNSIWRITNGGPQSSPLNLFGGVRYIEVKWSLHRCNSPSPIPIFSQGQGTCLATFIATGFHHHLDELTKAFLGKFFPPSKTASIRNQITVFTQREDQSLYEAWELFKDLLRLCPHHGLQRWMIIHIFYNGVTQAVWSTIDAAARGTLMNKTDDEAFNLIDEMALNNFEWSTEQG